MPAPALDPALEIEELRIQVGNTTIMARLYQKSGVQPSAAVLWLHGGGFAGGTMNMPEGDSVARSFAHAGYLVLNLDYRIVVPSCDVKELNGVSVVRYPIRMLDGQAAFTRLRQEALERGVSADHLFLGGASAGGNLAVNTLAWNIQYGKPVPAGLILAYPFVHGYPINQLAMGGWLSQMVISRIAEKAATCFVGSRDPERLALIQLDHEKLRGFPPVIIVTGEHDPLRLSGEAFADDLRCANVKVVTRFEPNTTHGHLNEPEKVPFDRTMRTFNQWIYGQIMAK